MRIRIRGKFRKLKLKRKLESLWFYLRLYVFQFRKWKAVNLSNLEPLPVFLISFNRGKVLERSIALLESQSRPTKIIINDFGSDDPETLHVLKELEARGVSVFRKPKIATADDLNLVDETVQSYNKQYGYDGPYAVSDCDVWFDKSDTDSLLTYERLLDHFSHLECVGPMLRISDIPEEYPLYAQVMNRHIEQFWKHKPFWLNVAGKKVPCLPSRIDTTFAVHRAGSSFRRLKKGLRLYGPYDATHIDWYLTEQSFFGSEYFKTSNPQVAHWNNPKFQQDGADVRIAYDGFYDVSWSFDLGKTIWKALERKP